MIIRASGLGLGVAFYSFYVFFEMGDNRDLVNSAFLPFSVVAKGLKLIFIRLAVSFGSRLTLVKIDLC